LRRRKFIEEVAEEGAGFELSVCWCCNRSKAQSDRVLRKIAEECDSSGRVLPDTAKLRFDPRLPIQARFQLARRASASWRPVIREARDNEVALHSQRAPIRCKLLLLLVGALI